jgi:FAD/FMN-containing dehydrogenase/Fe-S oxidoreductase
MIPSHLPEASAELIHDLRRAIPEIYFDRLSRLLYSTDASIYQIVPLGIVAPRDADEVAAAVEIAGKHNVPVLPRGSGSSLDGQAVGQAVVIDVSRHLNRVVEVNAEARTVRVQPGITLAKMNRILSSTGLCFGPDPASAERATIGGIVGNNSTGAHSIVYGMTSDHVHALDVILSDGSRAHLDALNGDSWDTRGKRPGLEGAIYRAVPGILDGYADPIATNYPKTWRTVAGYNLNHVVEDGKGNIAKLVVGSEGTLAVTTEATLNLVKVPKLRRLALVHFSDMHAALQIVPRILETDPTAIELIDKLILDQTRDKLEYRRLLTFIEGDPEAVLIVEYSGESEAELTAGVDRLKSLLSRQQHHDPLVVVADAKGQANVWYVRKVGLGMLLSIKGDAKALPFIEDSAVPVEHLADYVDGVFEIVHQAGLQKMGVYAHASAGCLHLRPVINLKTLEGVRQLRQISEAVLELVKGLGGTLSGEHGEGLARGEFSERFFGSELVRAFHEVKAAFDPHGLMNPGKIVDCPRMDDIHILRFGSDYATPLEPARLTFNYSADGGFARSVEMCSGIGVCRKLEQGVMCPSFLVTQDEAQSTRGRANALRSAMMGMLGPDGVTSPDVYRVMDTCLSCKACKSECPTGVDMAKFKAEFLHGYQQKHGVPLRSRLFASIDQLNRVGRLFTPLTNLMLRGPVKWGMVALGVHPNRPLPLLADQSFSGWWNKHRPQNPPLPAGGEGPGVRRVVFFDDTQTEHNHPHIGQAAVKVLEAAGYAVIIERRQVCCGRPAISKGLLDQAADLARRNIEVLAPYAQAGIPIVGIEPACMAALADEYPDLVPGEAAQAVARQALLIEDFIAQEAKEGRFQLDLDDTPRAVLLHGHCNQKALWGTAGSRALLEMIPNLTLTEIDSSCCGMAGTFGYEQEHFEMSIALAEISLAPAVRAAPAETLIAAPGASCREQIDHTAGRAALHPIEIVAGAIRG